MRIQSVHPSNSNRIHSAFGVKGLSTLDTAGFDDFHLSDRSLGCFQGVTFQGGTFQGGALLGGTLQGGTLLGGTFQGGTFQGAKVGLTMCEAAATLYCWTTGQMSGYDVVACFTKV